VIERLQIRVKEQNVIIGELEEKFAKMSEGKEVVSEATAELKNKLYVNEMELAMQQQEMENLKGSLEEKSKVSEMYVHAQWARDCLKDFELYTYKKRGERLSRKLKKAEADLKYGSMIKESHLFGLEKRIQRQQNKINSQKQNQNQPSELNDLAE
jgi:hypothetical protein